MTLLLHVGMCATLEEAGGLRMHSERCRRSNYLKGEFTFPFFCLSSFQAPLQEVVFSSESQHTQLVENNQLMITKKQINQLTTTF